MHESIKDVQLHTDHWLYDCRTRSNISMSNNHLAGTGVSIHATTVQSRSLHFDGTVETTDIFWVM